MWKRSLLLVAAAAGPLLPLAQDSTPAPAPEPPLAVRPLETLFVPPSASSARLRGVVVDGEGNRLNRPLRLLVQIERTRHVFDAMAWQGDFEFSLDGTRVPEGSYDLELTDTHGLGTQVLADFEVTHGSLTDLGELVFEPVWETHPDPLLHGRIHGPDGEIPVDLEGRVTESHWAPQFAASNRAGGRVDSALEQFARVVIEPDGRFAVYGPESARSKALVLTATNYDVRPITVWPEADEPVEIVLPRKARLYGSIENPEVLEERNASLWIVDPERRLAQGLNVGDAGEFHGLCSSSQRTLELRAKGSTEPTWSMEIEWTGRGLIDLGSIPID